MTNVEQYINREKNTCNVIPSKVSDYLQVDNFLSEYDTDAEKEIVMLNILLLDETPTEGSTKLLNSDSVYKALSKLQQNIDNTHIVDNVIVRTQSSTKNDEIYVLENVELEIENKSFVIPAYVKKPAYVVTLLTDQWSQILKVEKGKTLLLPDPPVKNGYTFRGWYIPKESYTGECVFTVIEHDNVGFKTTRASSSNPNVNAYIKNMSVQGSRSKVWNFGILHWNNEYSLTGNVDNDTTTIQSVLCNNATGDLDGLSLQPANWVVNSKGLCLFNGNRTIAVRNVIGGDNITINTETDIVELTNVFPTNDIINGQFVPTENVTLYAAWSKNR